MGVYDFDLIVNLNFEKLRQCSSSKIWKIYIVKRTNLKCSRIIKIPK